MRRLSVISALAFLLAMAVASRGLAADSAPVITEATIGFGGSFKVGCWVPARVRIDAASLKAPAVVVIAPDAEGNLVEMPLTASQSDPAVYEGVVQVGRLDAVIRTELRDGQTVVAQSRLTATTENEKERISPYRHNTEFWGVFGNPEPFAKAAEMRSLEIRRAQGATAPPAAIVVPLKLEDIPLQPDAWDALDVIAISGASLQLNAEQDKTLRRWTSRGGRLIVLLGSETEAFQKSPLAQWARLPIVSSRIVSTFEDINTIVPRSKRLALGRTMNGVPGALLAGSGDLATRGLIARVAYGAGDVTGFALDFDHQPLSQWEQLPELCLALIRSDATTIRAAAESDVSATGVTDLSTQLLSNLDQFSEIERPSFGSVLMWTFAWVLVLCPLDYLIVHRWLKKPQLTWITLPLWIVAATLAGSRSANAANARPMMSNQLDLMDVSENGMVSTRSWTTFYNDRTARERIAAAPAAGGQPARICWAAKPEEGLRGLYRRGGISFGTPTYRLNTARTEIEDLPVRIWSSAAVEAEWEQDQPARQPLISGELRTLSSGRLRGSIRHHFVEPITDWFVVYRNFVFYPLAQRGNFTPLNWAPDTEWIVESGDERLVKSFLTGQREAAVKVANEKDTRNITEVDRYDPLERNPLRLLRILSFHSATGGGAYTGLSNHALAKLDVSRLITIDEGVAILFARLKTPVTKFNIDGQPLAPAEHWTFLRAMIPVKPAPTQ
jgi:hypothetical protein